MCVALKLMESDYRTKPSWDDAQAVVLSVGLVDLVYFFCLLL